MKACKPGTDQSAEFRVLANGVECPEYILPAPPVSSLSQPNIMECFIPVNSGDRIAISGRFDGSVLHGRFDLVVDGSFLADSSLDNKETVKYTKNRKVEFAKALNHPYPADWTSNEVPKEAYVGYMHTKKLFLDDFNTMKKVEIPAPSRNMPGVGSIMIVVSASQHPREAYYYGYEHLTVGRWRTINEHGVRMSGICPDHEVEFHPISDIPITAKRSMKHRRHNKQTRPGLSEAWAKFIFYYRSQRAIDNAGCASRPDIVQDLEPDKLSDFVVAAGSPLHPVPANDGEERHVPCNGTASRTPSLLRQPAKKLGGLLVIDNNLPKPSIEGYHEASNDSPSRQHPDYNSEACETRDLEVQLTGSMEAFLEPTESPSRDTRTWPQDAVSTANESFDANNQSIYSYGQVSDFTDTCVVREPSKVADKGKSHMQHESSGAIDLSHAVPTMGASNITSESVSHCGKAGDEVTQDLPLSQSSHVNLTVNERKAHTLDSIPTPSASTIPTIMTPLIGIVETVSAQIPSHGIDRSNLEYQCMKLITGGIYDPEAAIEIQKVIEQVGVTQGDLVFPARQQFSAGPGQAHNYATKPGIAESKQMGTMGSDTLKELEDLLYSGPLTYAPSPALNITSSTTNSNSFPALIAPIRADMKRKTASSPSFDPPSKRTRAELMERQAASAKRAEEARARKEALERELEEKRKAKEERKRQREEEKRQRKEKQRQEEEMRMLNELVQQEIDTNDCEALAFNEEADELRKKLELLAESDGERESDDEVVGA